MKVKTVAATQRIRSVKSCNCTHRGWSQGSVWRSRMDLWRRCSLDGKNAKPREDIHENGWPAHVHLDHYRQCLQKSYQNDQRSDQLICNFCVREQVPQICRSHYCDQEDKQGNSQQLPKSESRRRTWQAAVALPVVFVARVGSTHRTGHARVSTFASWGIKGVRRVGRLVE